MIRQILPLSLAITISAAFSLTPTIASAQSFRLPITYHHQEHSLSCEVATLKIALKTLGIEVSESQLIAELPFDPTPKSNGIWGDPNQGFVGNIDGRMLTTGYGVYWDPIANLGAKYAHTEVIRHGSAQDLARQVSNGNPVIIWTHYGDRALYAWRTRTGQTIKAIDGEHTMTVYGFDGPVESPTRFYLMDPLAGYRSWSTAELMNNWNGLDRMGVAVSKHPRWVRVPGDTRVWELENNTRRWITTWQTFTRRGGTTETIKPIDRKTLQSFQEKPPIN